MKIGWKDSIEGQCYQAEIIKQLALHELVHVNHEHIKKVMEARAEGHVCERIGKPPKWKPWLKILCSICGARETTKKQRRHYA